MLKFYDIDKEYIKFLKTIDTKIPNVSYDSKNKFLCGVVLCINNTKYYAPISHNTTKHKTSILIYDNETVISSIRFSFMVPAFNNVLTVKDFSSIAKIDNNYANLLYKEYNYCKEHEEQIRKKAYSVYRIGCNKNHVLNNVCCDFAKLEEHYLEYKK